MILTMNRHAITVLKIAIKGPVDIIDLIEELEIQPWQIYSHIRSLRQKDYVVLEASQIHLRKDWKARLLNELAEDVDIEKILLESNEEIISFLIRPICIDSIVEQTHCSRSTVYRAIKDFKSIGIIKKVSNCFELNEENQAVIDFAKWLAGERESLEAYR